MSKPKIQKKTDCPIKAMEFTYNGVLFRNVGIDLETDLVTIKNVVTGKYKEIDYNKLQELLKK